MREKATLSLTCRLPATSSPAGGRTAPSVILPRGQNATSPIWLCQTVEASVDRLSHLRCAAVEARTLFCHFDRGSVATERRNLLYMQVGSQIPPLASLGRDDKRGRRAAEGVGPYGRDDKRRGGATVETRGGRRLRSARPPRRRAETAFFGPNYSKLYEGPKTPLICGT